MSQESLDFSITLSGTFWDKRPQFSIWIGEHVVVQSELPDQKPHVFKFSHQVDRGHFDLKIRLENKNQTDTVVENNTITKDMLLNILDIEVNDISIDKLIYSADYILDKPQIYQDKLITKLNNCVNLGWNGTYLLRMSSPFNTWLLQKF